MPALSSEEIWGFGSFYISIVIMACFIKARSIVLVHYFPNSVGFYDTIKTAIAIIFMKKHGSHQLISGSMGCLVR